MLDKHACSFIISKKSSEMKGHANINLLYQEFQLRWTKNNECTCFLTGQVGDIVQR